MNWLTMFGGIIGTAETVVPVFIHNPQSQKIEGVVVTQANNLFALLAQLQAQTANTKGPEYAAVPSTPATG